jgi:hypothetical protein
VKKKKAPRRLKTEAIEVGEADVAAIEQKQAGAKSRLVKIGRLLVSEDIASPPPGRPRAVASAVIGAYLLWQILLPLSYYLGGDRADERFAWRMFSARREVNKTCRVHVIQWFPDGGSWSHREIRLGQTTQPTWTRLLERRQPAVVEKFLRTRCALDSSVEDIQFVRTCAGPDGTRSRFDDLVLNCRTGLLTRERVTP